MRGKLLSAGFVAALAGCQGGSSQERMTLEAEPASIAALNGFESRIDRNATVFTHPSKSKASSSIVIRTVPLSERSDRTPDAIAQATHESLQAMPNAVVSKPSNLDDSELEGVSFDVTFEPQSKRGKPYQRRHVVLFGDEHAFHVVHTAPKGRMDDLAKEFERVVSTLEEELPS